MRPEEIDCVDFLKASCCNIDIIKQTWVELLGLFAASPVSSEQPFPFSFDRFQQIDFAWGIDRPTVAT